MFQHFLDLQLVGEHQYSATLLHSHDTDTRATMNMAIGNGVIAAGQDGTCCLMQLKHCPPTETAAKDGKTGAQCSNFKFDKYQVIMYYQNPIENVRNKFPFTKTCKCKFCLHLNNFAVILR